MNTYSPSNVTARARVSRTCALLQPASDAARHGQCDIAARKCVRPGPMPTVSGGERLCAAIVGQLTFNDTITGTGFGTDSYRFAHTRKQRRLSTRACQRRPRRRNEPRSDLVLDRLNELRDSGNASETAVSAIDAACQIGNSNTCRESVHIIEKDRR